MNKHLNSFTFLLLMTAVFACAGETNVKKMANPSIDTLTYLALGDSYTIGESVEESERYPVQIKDLINEDSAAAYGMSDPLIIATTGWTTDELQNGIEKADIAGSTYDYVSLLIGVNNQYRGYPIDQYIKEFEELLVAALAFAANDSNSLVVISIPDYGVTPFGLRGDKEKIARELDEYNRIAQEIATRYGVDFLNITEISREAENNPDLVATDQLHPSGLQYKRWVDELIYPWFLEKLAR
jgi:lysophospholipase L1-like esterase